MSVTPEVITLDHSPCLWLAAPVGQKNGKERRPQIRRFKLIYHRSATENPFTKSDLMKSILPDSAVLDINRCIGFVAVMALAALPAVGAGSAKQAVRKDSDPSIAIYNQGVELMLAKRFPEAQAKFEQAVKENPRFAEAHNNLGYTLRKQGAANYQKSLEHYNTAIELKPKLAEAYYLIGDLKRIAGRRRQSS